MKITNDLILALLSIYVTCKYKGISFLDFFKSKMLNINSYIETL